MVPLRQLLEFRRRGGARVAEDRKDAQRRRALVAAHEKEIILLDLKPANIKLRDDGTARIDITATNAGQKVLGAARAFVLAAT